MEVFIFIFKCLQDKGSFLVMFLGIVFFFPADLREDILRTEMLFLIGKKLNFEILPKIKIATF